MQVPTDDNVDDDEDDQVLGEEQVILGAPSSVNWVTAGAVGAVRNQGKCSSCYAFSAAGAMEGIYKIKKGVLNTFSP